MSDKFTITDTFLRGASRLTPRNAVAALILDENERILLQLRDDMEGIFFPNHWSCFGGAIEEGETLQACLVRELEEEIGITFEASAIEQFIHIAFQPQASAPKDIERHFFLVRTHSDILSRIRLGEGSAFRFFTYAEVMQLANITPYDKFGAWLYFNQGRLDG